MKKKDILTRESDTLNAQLQAEIIELKHSEVLRCKSDQLNKALQAEIIELRHSRKSLLETEPLQNAIFNSINFSSIATDAKGVIQIFNVGAERMLGYTALEVVNKITPAEISDSLELVERAKSLSIELGTKINPGFEALVFKASRGIEDIYEITYLRRDGTRLPAIVSVTALRDHQSDIIGYLLIGTDNTVRKQVEAEQQKLDQNLRDQQFYTRSLIESNIDALMATNPSGVITDVNKQMESLTGCTRDELIGSLFKEYFTDKERAHRAITLVLTDNKLTNYELTVLARDGKETVVSCNATTFYDRTRRLQGVFAAVRDITEHKRLERVLQEQNLELEGAKLAAEKANLAKSDFLSSMSHELRTPLNAILGFAQIIEASSPLATASHGRGIRQILKAGWYLLELINEILDLAMVESGRLSLSMETVLLSEVLNECQTLIEPQAQQHKITITYPRPEIPYFVYADRTRLKQVLINLLSNATKYNKEGGTVNVSCATSTHGRIRISVKDTGEGLTADNINQLFQPFNRLGQEMGTEEGTGIGLMVTKKLVEMMNGEIGVESTVGSGCEFWIDLNLTDKPQRAVIAEPAVIIRRQAQENLRSATILYIEDNPANLTLVEELLAERINIRLLSATNGKQGLEIALALRPDLILMDLNLPGMSGNSAMKILANTQEIKHIPVIALSANAMRRDIEKGSNAGFFHYLTKPIKVKEFMNVLDEALDLAETRSTSRNN